MRKSNVIVEQVNKDGNIVNDYGEILSPAELRQVLSTYFNCSFTNDAAYGVYQGIKYCICYKNISYLGIPHPEYKKRIQIPQGFVETYYKNQQNNIPTFFIGVYKYADNIIFVNFKTDNYVLNKAHNSSAHVYAIDLAHATTSGHYVRTDIRNNEVFCFNTNNVDAFFKMYLLHSVDYTPMLFRLFDEFYDSLDHDWFGIDCYKEMIDNDYHRKFQPEWPGTYLEYRFEEFTNDGKNNNFVVYAPQRGKDGIDLDLFFLEFNGYGDLKAHSSNANAIVGNKTDTVRDLIGNDIPLFYIVFNHDTILDKEKAYEVCTFWNSTQNKDDLMSYHNRMKYSVHITSYMILEINKQNYHYLDDKYQVGFKNSDGQSRSAKISIPKKYLPNFIIHEHR